MYRLVRVLSILIFLISLESFALGLGSIESHSALNQPLDAEIEITGLGDVDISEVTVELASPEAFEKVGLDRPFYLTALKFVLEQKEDGTPVIHVTSREAVKEPFVDFLLEVNWPAGHILREYTILLDPPLFLDEGRAVVETPVAGTAPVQSVAAPSRMQQAAASAPQAKPRQQAGGSPRVVRRNGELSYGSVTRSDTLWSIAKQMRPDDSVTVQQVMMALLKNNPDAFYNNNVNYLKAGYVLRIPDISQIAQISPAEAEREIRRQHGEWLDAKGQLASRAAPRALGADTAAAGAPSGAGAAGGPRLKLVVPDASGEGAALEGVSDGTASGAGQQASLDALRSELALALENSEISRQENMELKARLAALEEQIASMQRLLTLRGDTLAALQSDAVGVPAIVEEHDGAAEPAVAEDQGAAEKSGEQTSPAAAQSADKPQPKAAAPVAAPAAAPETAEPDLIATILDDPMLMGIAVTVILVLLIMAWIVVRKRQEAAEMDFEEYMEEPQDDEGSAPASAVAQSTAQSDAAAAVAGGAGAAAMAAGTVEAGMDSSAADSGLDIFQADEDEIDTLAEADVYLAYRRFDKAEELLKSAIEQSPGRHDYILKLLEVYAADENLDAFVEQAESLYASLGSEGGETWDKVVEMGRQLDSAHPLFGGDGEVVDEAPAVQEEAAGGEEDETFDFDLSEDLSSFETEAEAAADDATADDPEEADLDDAFSLLDENEAGETSAAGMDAGEPSLEMATAEPQTEELQTEELASDLDLDLDLGEDLPDMGEMPASQEKDEAPSPFAQLDDEMGSAESEAHKEELDEFEAALEADADNLMQDTNEEAEARQEVGESTLEGAAEELRSASEALSFDLGADEAESFEDTEGKAEDEAIPAALEADIDWLASAVNEEDLNVDFEDEPELISGEDEISTKLDLARAYIDMGDQESARGILDEVLAQGSNDQKGEAEELIRLIA
ncbi:MAG TPA: hypothetical protein ENJ22_04615 [Gammaproteobacteria bacterium]|nr:hypothetical protein [Gammaproteobacteria bacterium]